MNQVKKLSGLSLASAAAALLISSVGVSTVTADEAKMAEVKCSGINSCKGTSACATATSACAGHNSCKGRGWLKVSSAEDCKAKGGEVIAAK